ncbi:MULTISPECIES: ThiF family adenylyltransferase [Thalassospira]|uniref:ThiF family adenylyltransferase n=1 Tax=Thalassospira aquimaris TaxID=3037796 RepID=A0ABT6GDI3_9PROT|nr:MULTISPECIES: ThiF family adenylyltransferase [Thalassospira]MDG4720064.1 ThiF family adenylyltransferase [Thalassospira sp. FZY0004]
MSWWISQARRALEERVSIANLQESVDWLKQVKWNLSESLRLSADFVIAYDGNEVSLEIIYPAFFPDVPPQVFPDGNVRLSAHQYGSGGELCLEFRVDNWEPDMTGAMMVESAYRLLSGERPAEDEQRDVPDAHRVTAAQAARGSTYRMVISDAVRSILEGLPERSITELELSELFRPPTWVMQVSRVGGSDSPLWSQDLLPLMPIRRSAFAVRVSSDYFNDLPTSLDDLVAMAKEFEHESLTEFIQNGAVERPVLFVSDGKFQLLNLFKGEEVTSACPYKTVLVPKDERRQSTEYDELRQKSVAVVGCGSVGSKVAASLARAGVCKFTLVDGDILFPGNIVRNELDQRSIGLNKPDAVKARIREINPSAEISVRRVLMGGQESSSSTEAALTDIASCDLVVDATADATIFSLCAAVARAEGKPMVWGEVFSGGVGGMVSRSRPDIDPAPLAARKQLAAWCADQGVPWDGKESTAYDLTRDDAPPLVADDSEVTIIAAHMTRFVVDILAREDTIFPYSAYAIGLQREWIFSAPFEVFPIKLEPEGKWVAPISDESGKELAVLIKELFPDAFEKQDES